MVFLRGWPPRRISVEGWRSGKPGEKALLPAAFQTAPREAAMGSELPHIDDVGRAFDDLAPGGVNVAGDSHERQEQAIVVCTVDLLFNGHPPLDGAGFCGCK